MKLTPWIDGSIKPVRAGVYQREYGDGIPYYFKFDCSAWYCLHNTIEGASERRGISFSQNLPWRGLAEQPK
jgi:hypothetical protein